MKSPKLSYFFFFIFFLLSQSLGAMELKIEEIRLLSVNSAITPATFDYLKQNFEKLPPTSFILLKLNTPGGLVSTTKDIITLVGTHKRPFGVWISPEGASASSAGAIIASAAHFIFMSPGTNIGAATPVGMGEDIKEGDGRQKVFNDLSALVRSLSTSRGRPAGPFEKMITNASSFTAEEAKELGIIDGIISSNEEVLNYLTQKKINLDGEESKLSVSGVVFKEYAPSTGQKILEVLANPSTAYILFLIGIALIYFEFQAPGGFISGAVGLCFLILSGISFQVLPLNWGAMGLILAGIFLMVLEIFIVSYGILALSGLVSFIMGSLFLFHVEDSFITVQYPLIFSALGGVVVSVGLITWYLFREQKKHPTVSHFFLPIGEKGVVLKKFSPSEYQIKVLGEIWQGSSEENLETGMPVEVTHVDAEKLIIKIKKTS